MKRRHFKENESSSYLAFRAYADLDSGTDESEEAISALQELDSYFMRKKTSIEDIEDVCNEHFENGIEDTEVVEDYEDSCVAIHGHYDGFAMVVQIYPKINYKAIVNSIGRGSLKESSYETYCSICGRPLQFSNEKYVNDDGDCRCSSCATDDYYPLDD